MRVAIDALALGSGRGGDETYMKSLLAGLAQAAEDRDAFDVYLRPEAGIPASIDRRPNFRVRRLAASWSVLRYTVHWPRALRREPADLIHSVTHAPLPSVIDTVLFLPDLSFHRHPELFPARTRLRLQWLIPVHLRRTAAIITISEFSKRDIVDVYRRAPEDVFVVPIGIEPAPQPAPAGGEGRSDPLDEIGGPFILYLGNLHPRKNVPRLIEAYRLACAASTEVARHRLVIAGARWWGNGAEEREARLAPPGSVVFLGRVSDAQRRRLLRRAAMLAYPSIFEGFGLPPVEAMAEGTPVLASNAGAIPEVVGDAALLVDPLDTRAMAQALTRLLGDRALRTRLRELGARRAARYTTRLTGERALAAFRHAARAGQSLVGAPA